MQTPQVVTVCRAAAPGPEGVFGAAVSPTGESLVLVTNPTGYHVGFLGADDGSTFRATTYFRLGDTCQTGNDLPVNAALLPHGLAAEVTAVLDPVVPSAAGQIRVARTARTFSGGPIAGSTYDFNQPASLSIAAGTLTDLTTDTHTLTLDAAGAATGSFYGCRTSGQATPHPGGKNLLNVTMTLDPATCAPGPATTLRTFSGFVLTYDLAAGGRRHFAYLWATDVTQWDWDEFFLTASSP